MATTELRAACRACERAVDMAALGAGDPHERLVTAYQAHLVTLRPEALPPPARARFLALHDQVCGKPPAGGPATTSPPSGRWTRRTPPTCWPGSSRSRPPCACCWRSRRGERGRSAGAALAVGDPDLAPAADGADLAEEARQRGAVQIERGRSAAASPQPRRRRSSACERGRSQWARVSSAR